MDTLIPWLVLGIYAVVIWLRVPKHVSKTQFYQGHSVSGAPPGIWLVGVSGAISWVMAKSVDNAMNLSAAFGIWGGIGYAAYWVGFIVAGVAIFCLRTRGGYLSIPHFLTSKYGRFAAKAFLVVIGIRLFNEVWSNTKVTSQFFGAEGSVEYWSAALAVTVFTVLYSWRGGLRSSLVTDAVQTLLLGLLLGVVLVFLGPTVVAGSGGLEGNGLVTAAMKSAGLTFLALALVQSLSYPFHDPVLTDRAFISPPKQMVKSFVIAGVLGGGFIVLFSIAGLYALIAETGIEPSVAVAVPQAVGLGMLIVFNAVMLTSAGSTLDSTFSASAKFSAIDWPNRHGELQGRMSAGRKAMIVIALLGNLPLLSFYIEGIGPAVIAATTISGTAVMGLAPIILLSWIRPSGQISFHLALWPGIVFGCLKVGESFLGLDLFPEWVSLGEGKYSQTLGLNVFGLITCTFGYLLGTVIDWLRAARTALAEQGVEG